MRLRVVVLLCVFVVFSAPAGARAYTAQPTPGTNEAEEQRAREDAEQHQREVAEAKEKEAQEAKGKEAHEREQAQRQRETEQAAELKAEEAAEGTTHKAAAVQCVVPSLTGDSLGAARRALDKAHCTLGRVSKPPGSHGVLVVTGQSRARRTKLREGAAVAIRLGPRKR